jgi:hypothetical protein
VTSDTTDVMAHSWVGLKQAGLAYLTPAALSSELSVSRANRRFATRRLVVYWLRNRVALLLATVAAVLIVAGAFSTGDDATRLLGAERRATWASIAAALVGAIAIVAIAIHSGLRRLIQRWATDERVARTDRNAYGAIVAATEREIARRRGTASAGDH